MHSTKPIKLNAFYKTNCAAGILDDETVAMMHRKRCGNKDNPKKDPSTQDLKARFKRYVLGERKWEDKTITYRLSQYSKKFGKGETDEDLAKALKVNGFR